MSYNFKYKLHVISWPQVAHVWHICGSTKAKVLIVCVVPKMVVDSPKGGG